MPISRDAYKAAGTAAAAMVLMVASSQPIVERASYASTPNVKIVNQNPTRLTRERFGPMRDTQRPMAAAQALLHEFGTYAADWDTYGADPISIESIEAANQILRHVDTWNHSVPTPMLSPYAVAPLASGGVQMEWRGLDKAVEVVVNWDGQLAYLVEDLATGDQLKEVEPASGNDVLDAIAEALITTAGA